MGFMAGILHKDFSPFRPLEQPVDTLSLCPDKTGRPSFCFTPSEHSEVPADVLVGPTGKPSGTQ